MARTKEHIARAPREVKPPIIHFEQPGAKVVQFPSYTALPRTYCGLPVHQEKSSDTAIEKVTCKRCQRSRAKQLRPKMRLIRVSYQAEFRGLKKGPLNPIGAKFKGDVAIEVFQSSEGQWKFRAPHNGMEIEELGSAPGKTSAQALVSDQFEEQVTAWKMMGATESANRREILPNEVKEVNGKIYFLEQETKSERNCRPGTACRTLYGRPPEHTPV